MSQANSRLKLPLILVSRSSGLATLPHHVRQSIVVGVTACLLDLATERSELGLEVGTLPLELSIDLFVAGKVKFPLPVMMSMAIT